MMIIDVNREYSSSAASDYKGCLNQELPTSRIHVLEDFFAA